MDADQAVALLPLVEGGNVGKSEDGAARGRVARGRLRRHGRRQSLVLQPLQQPHRSVAAAGAKDGSYGRICESAIQFGEPALIVARQVPVPPENSRVVLNAVAIGNDGEPGVE